MHARVKKILVVDDNPANRLVAGAMLEMLGYDYDDACDGAEALVSMSKCHYAAILMDVHMPDLDGLETTRRIRDVEQSQAAKPIPIIAVTADVTASNKKSCHDAGMDGVISKPYSSAELDKAISSHLI